MARHLPGWNRIDHFDERRKALGDANELHGKQLERLARELVPSSGVVVGSVLERSVRGEYRKSHPVCFGTESLFSRLPRAEPEIAIGHEPRMNHGATESNRLPSFKNRRTLSPLET